MRHMFFFILLCCGFFTAAAFRIEFGNNTTISQPVHDDLYIAGGTVTINAPIYGDLIIAGGTIIINDTVTNDILLAGGNVTFNGFAGDDIRCAGGNIRISKNVTGDVVLAGGSVIIDRGITIGGLLATGGKAAMDGNVNGELRGAFGELTLNGNIMKGLNCTVDKLTINGNVAGNAVLAARDIVIGNAANFNGDVRYWNKAGSLDFKQSVKNGKATYDPSLRIQNSEWYYLGAASVLGLLWYLGMALLMIMIVQYLFAATIRKAADTIFASSIKSLGYGFLFFIATPVAAVIAFLTIVGVPVGLLLFFVYITLLLLATVIISVVGANWFNNRNNHQWSYWRLVFAAFGLFIILKIVQAAPFVGWLLIFVMACISFGGILLNLNWKRKPAVALTD
ncbi:hypothetical protein QWZ08_01260 [Ferruginibacter paludis]|uniref:hypothetical protein n=1 Tax=Ferruginibacter paludis TaxID=1310417 RepID=UPI0025B508E5|nr:hypothetical protein [Ferruginibacter paludis]MDN3654231.1 hypothetical protein [Ferruginibacter paludis]